MDNLSGATARLRRTFRYPGEDDEDDSQPEAMDEEEQEHLIRTLAAENATRNAQFRLLLLALPAATSLPYLIALFSRPTFLLSVLALTSLASTAYLLYHQPPGVTGIDILDAWARAKTPRHSPTSSTSSSSSGASSSSMAAASASGYPVPGMGGSARRRESSFSFPAGARLGQHKTPLEQYLPFLNIALCVILVVAGAVMHVGEGHSRLGRIGLGNLPAFVYGVVLVANMVMAGVDPEKELGALKYEYKGA